MKKIIILLLLLLPINIYAAPKTIDRNTLDNLGVNKHWKITDKNRSNVLNTYLVDASEKIYDFSDILTKEEEKLVYDKFNSFIEKNNTDLVFLTVDLPYTYDSINEDYAADFYDYNDFRNKRYYDGLITYIDLLNNYYESGIAKSKENYIVDENGYLQKVYHTPYLFITITSLIIDSIIILVLIKRNKMVKAKLYVNNYLDQKRINITNKEDRFIRSHTSSYTVSSSSSGGGGSSHSSSGSSGGGHSSGGGRHG